MALNALFDDKEARRIHEADTAALYALVRDRRPPWTRLTRSERQWWLNGGVHVVIPDNYPLKDFREDDFNFEGDWPRSREQYFSDYDLAVNRQRQFALEAGGHKPNVLRVSVIRYDGSTIETLAIGSLCDANCLGCQREASKLADEFENEIPAGDPTVHQTTLGALRFELPDYSMIAPHEAITAALANAQPSRDAEFRRLGLRVGFDDDVEIDRHLRPVLKKRPVTKQKSKSK